MFAGARARACVCVLREGARARPRKLASPWRGQSTRMANVGHARFPPPVARPRFVIRHQCAVHTRGRQRRLARVRVRARIYYKRTIIYRTVCLCACAFYTINECVCVCDIWSRKCARVCVKRCQQWRCDWWVQRSPPTDDALCVVPL